jgi:hypothetical protein
MTEKKSIEWHRGQQYYISILLTALTIMGGFSTYMAKMFVDDMRTGMQAISTRTEAISTQTQQNSNDIAFIKGQIAKSE